MAVDLLTDLSSAVAGRPKLREQDVWKRLRLPVGGAVNRQDFELQTVERLGRGKGGVLAGMSVSLVLDDEEKERDWKLMLGVAGATVREGDEAADVDVTIVDSLALPPYVTSSSKRVSKAVNVAEGSGVMILDLSFVVQCVVQNRMINIRGDLDPIYKVRKAKLSPSGSKVYRMETKAGVRIEVGEVVELEGEGGVVTYGRVRGFGEGGAVIKTTFLTAHEGALVELETSSQKFRVSLDKVRRAVVCVGTRNFKQVEMGWAQKDDDTFIRLSNKNKK